MRKCCFLLFNLLSFPAAGGWGSWPPNIRDLKRGERRLKHISGWPTQVVSTVRACQWPALHPSLHRPVRLKYFRGLIEGGKKTKQDQVYVLSSVVQILFLCHFQFLTLHSSCNDSYLNSYFWCHTPDILGTNLPLFPIIWLLNKRFLSFALNSGVFPGGQQAVDPPPFPQLVGFSNVVA